MHEVKPRNTHILIPVLSAPLLCGGPPGTYESKRKGSILHRERERFKQNKGCMRKVRIGLPGAESNLGG